MSWNVAIHGRYRNNNNSPRRHPYDRTTPNAFSSHFKSKAPKPSSWGRRIVVALALTGIIGTALVITLTVLAARFVGGAVDYLQSVDMTALQRNFPRQTLNLASTNAKSSSPS
jgi:hypothetical protein